MEFTNYFENLGFSLAKVLYCFLLHTSLPDPLLTQWIAQLQVVLNSVCSSIKLNYLYLGPLLLKINVLNLFNPKAVYHFGSFFPNGGHQFRLCTWVWNI